MSNGGVVSLSGQHPNSWRDVLRGAFQSSV
jgi:hypothetical protein